MLVFEKLRSFFRKLANRFMDFSIGIKMSIVYIVVILIPTILYSGYFFIQTTENIINIYEASSQQLLEQSYANFKTEISVLESTYRLFQYNSSIIDFLSGYYTTESEEVYTYLKDVRPLFAYAHASNGHIEDITIYKFRKTLVDYQHLIKDVEQFGGNTDIIAKVSPDQGKWVFDTNSNEKYMRYYRKLYSTDFEQELGFIEISVKSEELFNMFNVTNDNQIFLLNQGSAWYVIQNGLILNRINRNNLSNPLLQYFFDSGISDMNNGKHSYRKLLVHFIKMSDLDAEVYLLTSMEDVMGKSKDYAPLFYLAILLVILTLIYYVMISSVTSRIVRFAKHIRRADHDHLYEYKCTEHKDEVGLLIKSYNEMIVRIGSLINSVNIAELKKKEADFYALQAQIKPHFIYNSLETIRMMAEMNDDSTVADMIYNLGRFMRYNLSRKKRDIRLRDEIENVRSYLQIYKASMGERLDFHIHVNCDIDSVKCPGFILQPLVENCFHHGLSSIRRKGIIEVSVTEDNEYVIIYIKDNGAGIQEDRLKVIKGVLDGVVNSSELDPSGNGIGIVNVNERIKSYFGERSGLSIDSKIDVGTTCRIQLEKIGGVIENADDDSR